MFGKKDKDDDKVNLSKVNQAVGSVNTPGVSNLSVRQKDNVYEIHGSANDLAAKQRAFKAITDKVGDTAGVVNLITIGQEPGSAAGRGGPLQTGIPGQGTAQGGRTHTVKKGETLSHISQHYYGKASEFNKIFDANKDQLKDPDKIREGMTLRIP